MWVWQLCFQINVTFSSGCFCFSTWVGNKHLHEIGGSLQKSKIFLWGTYLRLISMKTLCGNSQWLDWFWKDNPNIGCFYLERGEGVLFFHVGNTEYPSWARYRAYVGWIHFVLRGHWALDGRCLLCCVQLDCDPKRAGKSSGVKRGGDKIELRIYCVWYNYHNMSETQTQVMLY